MFFVKNTSRSLDMWLVQKFMWKLEYFNVKCTTNNKKWEWNHDKMSLDAIISDAYLTCSQVKKNELMLKILCCIYMPTC